MNKVINYIMNNKIKVLICGVILVLIIVGIVLFMNKTKVTQEQKLNTSLEALGRKYYEEYYYPSVADSEKLSDKADFLRVFSTIGLSFKLNTLLKYNDSLENKDNTQYINKNNKEECDKEKTIVTIYPEEPYEKNNYRIEVKLECGFNN